MLHTGEIPLQYDLFTRELKDNRTAEQRRRDNESRMPTQMLMFSQRDIAQIGVSANPRMDVSPGRLKLISEDPRTEEEKEQDRLHEAQSLTASLFFGDTTTMPPQTSPEALLAAHEILFSAQPSVEIDETNVGEDEIEEPLPPVETPLSQYAAYRQLVAAAEEQAATISASPAVLIAQRISLSAAQFAAKHAGLTETEITTAITIGNYRGRTTQKPLLPEQLVQLDSAEPASKPGLTVQPPIESEPIEPEAEETEFPIVWLYRSDLLKRRPDLAEKIQALREHEIEALAALVGEALEEFYWIQLNFVLSLYLDHELALYGGIPHEKVREVTASKRTKRLL